MYKVALFPNEGKGQNFDKIRNSRSLMYTMLQVHVDMCATLRVSDLRVIDNKINEIGT